MLSVTMLPMLNKKEIQILRDIAPVHKAVFEEIKKVAKPWVDGLFINELAGAICKKWWVLPAFKWVYGFPANICISINDVVVHGVPLKKAFHEGDVIKFDFGVKDKKVGVNTDAAFTMIIGDWPHHAKVEKFLEVNKHALKLWVREAVAGNRTGDIWHAIQTYVEKHGFHIVKELTWHGIGKTLHEKPYVYNYGKKWVGDLLEKWMVIAIEPIIWFSSGRIFDMWGWEIYIKDGSYGSQFEHTILITDGEPEIII